MSSADPRAARDLTTGGAPPWSTPARDVAAREAARRALARAATERDAIERAATEREATRSAEAARQARSRWWSFVAACAVVVLGAGTVSVGMRGATPADDDAAEVGGEVSAARAGDAVDAPGAPVATSDAGSTAAGGPPTPTLDPTAHGAVYEGGHVTLRGTVPTRAMADALRAKAVAVVGASNVTDEYVIDPAAPSDVDGRVRIADPVLFRTGSAQLDPRFAPLLDAGVVLMQLNPQVVLQVVGHTDDVGDEEANRALSVERARAVVAYVQGKAAFGDERFVVQGMGESQPIADNATPEGRTANRRIEVTILGLLVPSRG